MGQNPLLDRIHYGTESTMGQNPLWDRIHYGTESTIGQNPLLDRIHYWTESTKGQNPPRDRLYMIDCNGSSVCREGERQRKGKDGYIGGESGTTA